MPQVLVARITCPNCNNQFQVPVEQLLDVRADPSAKMRLLNGLVNAAICPKCGMGGTLNLPFLYHDPDQALALVYMPMQAGRDDFERQRAIGTLTTAVMNSLPPEERKAYLLQPQVFFTFETLVNKVLEADGVTPEMIAEQKAKVNLLQQMIDAPSDEALETMIKEHDAAIDSSFLRLLNVNMEMTLASGREDNIQRLLALRNKLVELSTEGRKARARGDTLEALRAEPTHEKLVELLAQAPDEPTREMLVIYGRPLLDYVFFQALTSRIEATADGEERERLTALRTEVLAVRDRLDQETRALYEQRAGLLRDLLLTEDPEKLARRRAPELDQAFFNLVTANLRDARAAGDEQTVKSLQAIASLVLRLMEESLPPEVRLLNRLMVAEGDAEIEKLLQDNRPLVTEYLLRAIEDAQANVREESASQAAERLAVILNKVRGMIPPEAAGAVPGGLILTPGS
jgi:hypothetical protein